MTAVCQLTDIMAAKQGKDSVHANEVEVKRWLQRKAALLGKDLDYALGPEEILSIVNKMHDGWQEWLDREDWILAGMRAGGRLAYLPSLVEKRLQRYEDYNFPGEVLDLAGAHRIQRAWRSKAIIPGEARDVRRGEMEAEPK